MDLYIEHINWPVVIATSDQLSDNTKLVGLMLVTLKPTYPAQEIGSLLNLRNDYVSVALEEVQRFMSNVVCEFGIKTPGHGVLSI